MADQFDISFERYMGRISGPLFFCGPSFTPFFYALGAFRSQLPLGVTRAQSIH